MTPDIIFSEDDSYEISFDVNILVSGSTIMAQIRDIKIPMH